MKTFSAVRIEGGLFAPDLLEQLLNEELPGQKPANFGLTGQRNLDDVIASTFADAQALWRAFREKLQSLPDSDPATSLTRNTWVAALSPPPRVLPSYNQQAYRVGDQTLPHLLHRAAEGENEAPIHIVGANQELGRRAPGQTKGLSPHALLQEYLNRTEALWGIVTNGRVLRLLRDSTYIRRQCYVEFDLEAIFEQHLFNDFAALFRLLHRSRMPRPTASPSECLLEHYYQHSIEQGGRVRERLRDGVVQCLTHLANGFLQHDKNTELRKLLGGNATALPQLTPEEFYRQLLRLVYRFLFLFVAEDRGLISSDPNYLRHYSVSRFRRLVELPAAYTDHDDLWLSLRVLWKLLADDTPVQQNQGQPSPLTSASPS